MKRPLQNFGPWASNLNSPTRLFLSSFWRRRMHTIAQLRHTPTRVKRQVLVACGLVMLAIIGVPLVQFAPAVEAESADGPFVATFSNGVTVELIGLSVNPSPSEAWWKPDGSPLAERPYQESWARMGPGPGGINREVCWRWQNPGDSDLQTQWGVIPHPNSFGRAFGQDHQGDSVEDVTGWAFGLPTNRKTCTLRFTMTISSSEWETLMKMQAGPHGSTARADADGNPIGAAFGRPHLIDGDTVVTVSYQILGREVRLAAHDRDGKLHIAQLKSGGGARGFTQAEYHFQGVKPEQLTTWQLQARTRKAEVIDFQNVSLHPDQETEVVIRRVGDDPGSGNESPELDAPRREESSEDESSKAVEPQPLGNRDRALQRQQRMQQLVSELNEQHGYRLAEGELLKYIPDGPEQIRQDLNRGGMQASYAGDGEPPELPINMEEIAFLFYAGEDGLGQFNLGIKQVPTLRQILDYAFSLKRNRIEADEAILNTMMPGDWVLSWRAREDRIPREAEIAKLESILNNDLNLEVQLIWQEIEQPVLVARGTYQVAVDNPIAGKVAERADGEFEIPARRSEISASVGSYQAFLEAVGEVLMVPIVDEATEKPDKPDLFWRYSGELIAGNQPLDAETRQMVLEAITRQTGLTFTEDVRPVKTLVIERAD